jgi:hypothetical protein
MSVDVVALHFRQHLRGFVKLVEIIENIGLILNYESPLPKYGKGTE